MAGHVLTSSRFLHVRVEGGKVVVRKRYVRGDSLDALNAEEIERLVRLGAAKATDDAGEGQGSEEPSPTPEGQDGATDGQDGAVETYEGEEWDKDRLQAEAEARDLPKSGTKAELAERLRDYDEAQRS